MLISVEVIGMLKRKGKIGTSFEVGKSENRIVRMLRLHRGLGVPLDGQEGRDQESGFEGSWEETRNALLEAERSKANAVLRFQQNNQRFC